jgi:hypothetical protein
MVLYSESLIAADGPLRMASVDLYNPFFLEAQTTLGPLARARLS